MRGSPISDSPTMRILAIGDVHGCQTALECLLESVQPQPQDLLVFLGDYIDRGPDSRGVLQRLQSLQKTHRVVVLGGNHEQMLLEARLDDNILDFWLASGGQATLESYRSNGEPASLDDLPDDDWTFLEGCLDWLETERWIFVHANLEPDLPLEHQSLAALRWQKFDDPLPHCSGKTMICGHTRQVSGVPRNIGHAICIDTWVYGDGWLSCLEPATGHVWQANQRGQTRELWVQDFLERRSSDVETPKPIPE